MRQGIITHLNSLRDRGGDTRLPEIDLTMCQVVEDVESRLKATEERLKNLEHSLDDRFRTRDVKIEDHQVILEYQHESLRELMLHTELLDGVVRGVSPYPHNLCI